jgi:PPP family 3-phenylpropionic acid transporter
MQTISLFMNRPSSWWRIRFYYFVFVGGIGFLTPFMTLFYNRQGLTGTQIGVIGSVGALVGLVAAPTWGRWGDSVGRPNRLLKFSFLISMVLMLIVSQQTSFLVIALIIGLNEITISGTEPLSTVLALKPMQGEKKSEFGSIRLWGSLGWAIIVYVSGWMIEHMGIFTAFVGYGFAMLLSAVMIGSLARTLDENLQPTEERQLGTVDVIKGLVRNRKMVGLGLALMVSLFSRIGTLKFEPLYMESLGAGESIIGLASTLGASIELPAMLWADRLIRRYGAWLMLQINFIMHALMAIAVLLLPRIPTILATRLLGGIAYSLFVVSIVVFLNENTLLGQRGTVLAIYTVTLPNIIVLLGSPLGGWIYDEFGAYWLYKLALFGSLVSFVITSISYSKSQFKGEKNV